MENNIILKDEQKVEIVESKEVVFNANVGEEPRRLQIKTQIRENQDTKNKFKAVSVLMHLDVYDVDGNYEGKKNRWVNLKFTKEAWKNLEGTSNVKSVDDLTLGFLYVRAKGIQAPRSYRPSYSKLKDGSIKYDKNGEAEIKYPEVWIKEGIIGFEQYVSSQDSFDYKQTIDAETGEIKE